MAQHNQVQHNQVLCGGHSHVKQPAELGELGHAAVEFVKDRVPNVGKLVSFTTQVVAGTNYTFNFSDFNGPIKVWSKPWENNFLQITLPTGEKIRNH